MNKGKGYLEANSRTYISVNFTNTSPVLIKNVQLKCESPIKDIQPQAITYLGVFRSGETKTVSIPLKTGVGLEDNKYPLSFEVMSGNNAVEKKFSYEVTTKKPPREGIFIVTPPQYESLSDDTTILKLTVKNTTKVLAQNLGVKIELPRGLKAVGSTSVSITSLGANKTTDIRFVYQGDLQVDLGVEAPKITCSLLSKTAVIDEVTVDFAPFPLPSALSSRLEWLSPKEGKADFQNQTTDKAVYNIELEAVTAVPVTRGNFMIFIDEQPEKGAKMDVVDLSEPNAQNRQYRQFFKASIELEAQKTTRIRVALQMPNGKVISSIPLTVKYDAERSNLFVVSIGTTQSDLKYTQQDASNIATFFRKQPDTLFKKITVMEHTQPNKTDYLSLKTVFVELAKLYETDVLENKIESKDYLLVFISSHGKTGKDKKYKLLPTNHKYDNDDDFAIDYQTEVIDKLAKINCRKLLFIDACHSGAAKGAKSRDNSEALMKISTASIGTTIITSCKSDEQSYEDEAWQNGAFTKALLEAFSNQNFSDEKGSYNSDTDNDSKLTIDEIMAFIKRRVPEMVSKQKNEKQNPVLVKNELEGDIPLIYLEKR